ncbi:hypothetical protein M8J75_001741 [Diaphorina citri]|nr:hypothetical protein M8J75_006399 [Diaphorina citri]KAI5704075.1 hypothetical protein M8J75_001741 [Diaphorina citri]
MALLVDEIDTIFARFSDHCAVTGMAVYDPMGCPIRSNMTKAETLNYIRIGMDLVLKAQRGIQDFQTRDELEMIRVRTGTKEVFIAPHKLFTLLVVQEVGSDSFEPDADGDAKPTCECPDTCAPCECELEVDQRQIDKLLEDVTSQEIGGEDSDGSWARMDEASSEEEKEEETEKEEVDESRPVSPEK